MNDSQQTSKGFLHFKPPLSTKGGKNKFFFANGNGGNNNTSQIENNENIQKAIFQRNNPNQSMNAFSGDRRHIRQASAGAITDICNTSLNNSTLNNTTLSHFSSKLVKKQSFSQLETIDKMKQKQSTNYLYKQMGLNSFNVQEKLQSKMTKYQTTENKLPIFFLNQTNDLQYNDFLNYQDSEENSFSSNNQSDNKLNVAKYDLRSYRDDNDEDDGKQLSFNFTLSETKNQFLMLSQNKRQQQIIQEQIALKQSQLVIKIQKNVKMFIEQRRYKKLKDATIYIQYTLRKMNKIKEKKIKDHLFVLSGQQKRVLKELEKLTQVENQINDIYKNNKRVQKFIKKNQSKLFEQFNNYNKSQQKQSTSSYTQTDITDNNQSINKIEKSKLSQTTINSHFASKASTHFTPVNSSRMEGYLTTQESEIYTERLHENCRCSSQKVIQKLRDELKQKVEYDSIKDTNTYKELLFIQDELHQSNIQHKSLMLQVSEALKKFEIKIITDLSSSNQQNFELIKDIQHINGFIQVFCSPQTVKRRQQYNILSSNESSSSMSYKGSSQSQFEHRKLVFDSARSYQMN